MFKPLLSQREHHPFFLPRGNFIPLCMSSTVFLLAINLLFTLKEFPFAEVYFHFFNLLFYYLVFYWAELVFCESEKLHTIKVASGILIGFLLLILSEAMLFSCLFYCAIDSVISPSVWKGYVCPPTDVIMAKNKFPYLNTLLLVASGGAVNIAHAATKSQQHSIFLISLGLSLVLGILFLMVQRMEFQGLLFFFEGSYPSIFFFLTCFHGSHVFIGVVLLSYQFFTIKKRSQLISQRFTGFLCSAWYWHFVDFVWIIVLTLIYVWPYM